MTYSRLLNLGKEIEDKLKAFLNLEIPNHRAERSEYDKQLVDWNKDYWAEPVTSEKTFPFKGACNIMIPLTAIAVESIHASNMTTLFGLKDFISVDARNQQVSDYAKQFEDLANHELTENINIKKKIESGVLCLEKFGNGIASAVYDYQVRYGMREVAGVETEFPVIVRDGVDIRCTHPSRFMMPFSSQDVQMSPWSGETHEATINVIEQSERDGLYKKGTADALRGYYASAGTTDDVQQQQEIQEHRQPITYNRPIQYYNLWFDWRVTKDENDPPKAIQVFYHYESQTIMGVRYNNLSDLRRPHRVGSYIPVENRWASIGICKQNDQFQLEVTIQHRQRIDNATIANIRMFKINKMSGYGPKEPIFPGKLWFLDDMNDLEAFQSGEIYPSAYNNEQQTLLYSQQRSGVNEGTLGMPPTGTPGTATAELSRVQEGKRKSDYTLDNIKSWITEVIYDAFDVMQTNRCWDTKYLTMNDPDGALLNILSLPNEAIRDSILFKLNIAGQNSNNILKRQDWQQVAQFTTQYYTQMMTLISGMNQPGAMQNPLYMGMVQKALQGGTEVFKQLLTSYEVKNIDRIIPMQLLMEGNVQNATRSVPTQTPAIAPPVSNAGGGGTPLQVSQNSTVAPTS